MENDYSNVAGATLLKSLFAVDILHPILQQFRNIFLEEHFSKFAEQPVAVSILWRYIEAATRGAV